jgi:hypothetical protein
MCEAQGATTTAKQRFPVGNGDTANPLSDSFSASNIQNDGTPAQGTGSATRAVRACEVLGGLGVLNNDALA